MEKIFHYDGVAYTVRPCSAIALCDNESEENRQPALLVSSEDDGETFDFVVFGFRWEWLEYPEDFRSMVSDSSAWEPLDDSHHVIP